MPISGELFAVDVFPSLTETLVMYQCAATQNSRRHVLESGASKAKIKKKEEDMEFSSAVEWTVRRLFHCSKAQLN